MASEKMTPKLLRAVRQAGVEIGRYRALPRRLTAHLGETVTVASAGDSINSSDDIDARLLKPGRDRRVAASERQNIEVSHQSTRHPAR
jgi:hypothetical protein